MKRIVIVLIGCFLMNFSNFAYPSLDKTKHVVFQFDGSTKFQQIHGIGVNANTRSWMGDKLEPAIDLLVDSMNASIWRIVVETVVMWEEVNDNNDPFTFNWDYYNRLYKTPKFQKVWEMMEYLNRKGITDNLMVNFMGAVPTWMGTGEISSVKLGGDIIEPKFEDEYVEMIVSFFVYAKNVKELNFGLVAPFNEIDHDGKEGPKIKPLQYVRLLRKLITKMSEVGMGDIQYVVPDGANTDLSINEYIPLLMKDPVIMPKIAHWGFHSYSGYSTPINQVIKDSPYPKMDFWMTEFNAWRDGLDDGQVGLYDYEYAAQCTGYLLDLLKNGATAALVWEGYDSYYEHHYPSVFSYWGILGYNFDSKKYYPRKHFYALSQVSRFVSPGSWQIAANGEDDNLTILAFYDPTKNKICITGINRSEEPIDFTGELINLKDIFQLDFYYTDSVKNLYKDKRITVSKNLFTKSIPRKSIFTFTNTESPDITLNVQRRKPEPETWYAGDIHVHRNCGEVTPITPESNLPKMMEVNDLAVITMLADMGNGEVKPSQEDMQKVNGLDAMESQADRIIHWDAEWHFDPAGVVFPNQALGGHLIFLGLKNAKQIWNESAYKIIEWGKSQNAIVGFAHMQYLKDSFPDILDCCTPIDYPVEAALGTIDFLSEDVWLNDEAINAYYRLLNCGFRLGWAAGTDFPCNDSEPLGSLLTYVQIKDTLLTYQKWIEGIKNGRTVVSTNGHKEFIEMRINDKYEPGDEIKIKEKEALKIDIKWTGIEKLSGWVELVCNGKVIARQEGTVENGKPLSFISMTGITKSSWICARRMDEKGHQVHTSPIYISVNNQPVRANSDDPAYFINWIDNILKNISPGEKWNYLFKENLEVVQERYIQAKRIYEKIAKEAKSQNL